MVDSIPIISVVTAPTAEPLTLDEAKAHLRVDGGDEDALIASYLTAARIWAEVETRRQFMPATLRMTLDNFPGRYHANRGHLRYEGDVSRIDRAKMYIPSPPLQSVASVKYIDMDGVQQTIDSSCYLVDAYSTPGRIAPAWGTIWPIARHQMNAIEVIFTAGYASAAAVPDLAKSLIRLLLSHQYENREAVVVSATSATVEEMPLAVKSIVSILRWGDYP